MFVFVILFVILCVCLCVGRWQGTAVQLSMIRREPLPSNGEKENQFEL